MTDRNILLVGSLPYSNEEEAMSVALDTVGNRLVALPDGEIGEVTEEFPRGLRSAWVGCAMVESARDTENWEIIDEGIQDEATGFMKDYDTNFRLKPKKSPAEIHKHINLRYHEYFAASYPVFKRLRDERGLPNLKMQVGLPTGLGVGFGMMHPVTALRYAGALNRRLAVEANEILKMGGDDVVLQIEIPAEIAMVYRLPGPLHFLPLRIAMQLISLIDPAHIGIHLCFGDLNNKALTQAPSLDPMIRFTNRMIDKWPRKHTLEYLHVPLAEGAEPPPTGRSFYEPLRNLKVPAGTRLYAGFVHEKLSPDDHRTLLQTIEDIRGQTVDVACSCGLGRRPRDVATQLMQLSEEVART